MTDRELILHPSVEADLESIAAYYAARDPALPSRFLARLGEQLDLLAVFPQAGAPYFEGYRRVLLRRFPFMAVYRTDERRTEVLAVLSIRRDPAWIEGTVTNRGEAAT